MVGSRARNFAAIIAAPIAGSLCGALIQFATTPLRGGSWQTFYWSANFGGTAVWMVVFNATLGLALHTFCYRRRMRGLNVYWIGGAFVGLVAAGTLVTFTVSLLALIREYDPLDYEMMSSKIELTAMTIALAIGRYAGAGAATGLFAWLLRRPDRDIDEERQTMLETF